MFSITNANTKKPSDTNKIITPHTPQKKRKVNSSLDFLEMRPKRHQFEGQCRDNRRTGSMNLACSEIVLKKANNDHYTRDNFDLANQTVYLMLDNHSIHIVIGAYASNNTIALSSIWIDGKKAPGLYSVAFNNVNPFSTEDRSFSISFIGIKDVKSFLRRLIHEELEKNSEIATPTDEAVSFQSAKQHKTSENHRNNASEIEWNDDKSFAKPHSIRSTLFMPAATKPSLPSLVNLGKTEKPAKDCHNPSPSPKS